MGDRREIDRERGGRRRKKKIEGRRRERGERKDKREGRRRGVRGERGERERGERERTREREREIWQIIPCLLFSSPFLKSIERGPKSQSSMTPHMLEVCLI